MNHLLRASVLLACCAAGPTPAQGPVPPTLLSTPQTTAGLRPPAVPVSEVWGLSMVHLPGDPPGMVTCCVDGWGMAGQYGGLGGNDVLTGHYDPVIDTFVPNALAAGLNTASGDEYCLRIHRDGLLAIYSRWAAGRGETWVAQRPSVTAPWQPLDLATLRIGTSRVVVRSSFPGGAVHSPDPILDAQGELIGFSHMDGVVPAQGVATGWQAFSFDLDPNTPPVNVFQVPGKWLMYAARIGDRVICIAADVRNQRSSIPRVFDAPLVWWPGAPDSCARTSWILVSTTFLPSPVPLAGVLGDLGIGPASSVALRVGPHAAANGLSSGSIPVPCSPSLAGVASSAQSVTVDLIGGPPVLSNTAELRIR